MGGFATGNLVQVGGLVGCVSCQHSPVCDILVELWRHPGPIRPCLGQHTLNVVDMCNRPQYRYVNEAELPYQALQVLPVCVSLGGGDV